MNDVRQNAANGSTQAVRRRVDLNRDVEPTQKGSKLDEQWLHQEEGAVFEGMAKDDGVLPVSGLIDSGLSPILIENMKTSRLCIEEISPLQRYTLPILLHENCYNLLVRAPTGCGKTAAFLLPAVQLVMNHHEKHPDSASSPLVLILSNTVTLSQQIYQHAKYFTGYQPNEGVANTGCKVFALFREGDRVTHRQIKYDIIVATSGGIRNALERGALDLSQLQLLVLDEADKMMDKRAFADEIVDIFNEIPDDTKESLRVALFSATFREYAEDGTIVLTDEMAVLLSRSLHNNTCVSIPSMTGYITQRIVKIDDPTIIRPTENPESIFSQSIRWLTFLIDQDLALHKVTKEGPFQKRMVIFVERKISCNFIAAYLCSLGYRFLPINSDYSGPAKQDVLDKLNKGSIQGVVATNQMARGQDVPNVDHVIIYEMSSDFNDYKHRIGRTGRIGHGGRSTAFVKPVTDQKHLVDLYKFLILHRQRIPEWLHLMCKDELQRRIREEQEELQHRIAHYGSSDSGDADVENLPVDRD